MIVSAIQMQCSENPEENIANAEKLVREASKQQASLVVLPELFERQYFCQERKYDYYQFATPVHENKAVLHFSNICKELKLVMPISFYEKDKNRLFNSIAMINADGNLLGVYRKTHIPDDHFYQEKFYFTAGDTGFKIWDTACGKIGVGICWDQWFPEAARAMTLQGAQILCYPTAIGSEPILNCDSMPHWKRCMQGHSASNIIPVIASNRYGLESVTPCEENANQESSLLFYGSSFITDETGEILQQADRQGDAVLTQEVDLQKIDKARLEWGLFRDRRPECYKILTEL
ncbi:MAG: N-carbamoylputrescine amidase [Oscillospiraceae bacterium]|nr:N-carbamoylputrescine amidase [Oscillospiraceae bacterium]